MRGDAGAIGARVSSIAPRGSDACIIDEPNVMMRVADRALGIVRVCSHSKLRVRGPTEQPRKEIVKPEAEGNKKETDSGRCTVEYAFIIHLLPTRTSPTNPPPANEVCIHNPINPPLGRRRAGRGLDALDNEEVAPDVLCVRARLCGGVKTVRMAHLMACHASVGIGCWVHPATATTAGRVRYACTVNLTRCVVCCFVCVP